MSENFQLTPIISMLRNSLFFKLSRKRRYPSGLKSMLRNYCVNIKVTWQEGCLPVLLPSLEAKMLTFFFFFKAHYLFSWDCFLFTQCLGLVSCLATRVTFSQSHGQAQTAHTSTKTKTELCCVVHMAHSQHVVQPCFTSSKAQRLCARQCCESTACITLMRLNGACKRGHLRYQLTRQYIPQKLLQKRTQQSKLFNLLIVVAAGTMNVNHRGFTPYHCLKCYEDVFRKSMSPPDPQTPLVFSNEC